MSQINLVLDLLKETQVFTIPEEHDTIDEICLFVNKGIDLSSFSVNITVYLESQAIFSEAFPPGNVILETTDLDIIKTFDCYFVPTKTYTITMSYVYNSKAYRLTFDAIGTKPPAPYASWVWNSNTNSWEAPVPYPLPPSEEPLMLSYVWNENSLEWSPLGDYEVV